MRAVYLGESDAPQIALRIQEAEEPECSVLTILQTQRVLVRGERERPSLGRQFRLLRRQLAEASVDWNVAEITPHICDRAGEPFPVEPVRTLDAIHLATALQFARAFPDLTVLTFDERILANLEPLGLLRAAP